MACALFSQETFCWLWTGWDVFAWRGLENDWWDEACLIQFCTLTLRTWVNVVNGVVLFGWICLTCTACLSASEWTSAEVLPESLTETESLSERRMRADYVFDHREKWRTGALPEQQQHLSVIRLFVSVWFIHRNGTNRHVCVMSSATITCQTLSNTNPVTFTHFKSTLNSFSFIFHIV